MLSSRLVTPLAWVTSLPWRDDGLLSPFPPDDQLQRNGGAHLYLWLFSGRAAGRAGQVQDAVPAERIVVDPVTFQEPYVPQEPAGRRVGVQPEHVLEESCHGREATPAHEVVFCWVARRRPLRSVVLPERSGLLEDLYHVVEIFPGDIVRQVVVAGPVESTQDHVVRGRPYAAEPVAAARVVLLVVGGERGHAMGSPEPFRILEVSDERRDPLLRHHTCQEGPEGADGLDVRERSVRKFVVVEGSVFVPQTLVDRQREPVTLFAQVRDLLGAAESTCHPQEQIRREDL